MVYYGDPNTLTFGVQILYNGEGYIFVLDLAFDNPVNCLIDNANNFYDNFNDSYTLTHDAGSGSVTRQGLCFWEGVDSNGKKISLEYRGQDNREFAYKWVARWSPLPILSLVAPKSGFMNDPVGSYENEAGTAVIS